MALLKAAGLPRKKKGTKKIERGQNKGPPYSPSWIYFAVATRYFVAQTGPFTRSGEDYCANRFVNLRIKRDLGWVSEISGIPLKLR